MFGGQWFILALLFTSVIFLLLQKYIAKEYVKLIIVIVVSAIGFAYSAFIAQGENFLITGIISLLFYYIGYLWSKFSEKFAIKKWQYAIIALVSGAITSFTALNNDAVLMYTNTYGNIPLFLLSAFFGFVTIYSVSKIIEKSKILEFFGKNSLIIVFINFPLFKCILNVFDHFGLKTMNFPWVLISFTIVMAVCTVCIFIINKYFSWMVGKLKF